MANFYFKEFTVRQTGAAMKVNTDGVLLPAWVSLPRDVNKPYSILDAGSGTGVISLIMAQRCYPLIKDLKISGIDIDEDSYQESLFNFSCSKWKDVLCAKHISLQKLAEDKTNRNRFDMILSNPPYFTNSLKAPSLRRSIARHNDSLTLSELVESSHLLLKDRGTLALILPACEGEVLISMVAQSRCYVLKRLCMVKTLENKEPKRYMMELCKPDSGNETCFLAGNVHETLVMQQKGNAGYSGEYINLVQDYYLKELKSI